MTDFEPLDPAFAALLADPRVTLRPPTPGRTMAAYRDRLDRPMAAVAGPPIFAVAAADTLEGVPLRIYRPAPETETTILFVHGGGFVTGSLDTHDALCRTLATTSGATVVAVGYRLAPEAPRPAALDDCRSALQWTVACFGPRVALCGDSAGGYLASMTALRAESDGIAVAALGLFYPVVSPSCATDSWVTLGAGHMLTREWMHWAWHTFLGDAASAFGPNADLLATDLSRLPPTHVATAAFDPLRDEGEALAAAIVARGGEATLTCYAGMIHGFASLPMLTPVANRAIASMGCALTCQQWC
jgi:acetyl esterase